MAQIVKAKVLDGGPLKQVLKTPLHAGTFAGHFRPTLQRHAPHDEEGRDALVAESGIDRNPANLVEVRRPDDQRDCYLSAEELGRLEQALDERTYRKGTKAINKTFYRLRLIVLIAVTTGMRASEIFSLSWSDVMYNEGLAAVRAKLKGGKMRYVPMLPELASERSAVNFRTTEKPLLHQLPVRTAYRVRRGCLRERSSPGSPNASFRRNASNSDLSAPLGYHASLLAVEVHALEGPARRANWTFQPYLSEPRSIRRGPGRGFPREVKRSLPYSEASHAVRLEWFVQSH